MRTVRIYDFDFSSLGFISKVASVEFEDTDTRFGRAVITTTDGNVTHVLLERVSQLSIRTDDNIKP